MQKQLGVRISTTFVGIPTVADDVNLMAQISTAIQAALDVVNAYNGLDRSTMNATKSVVLVYYCSDEKICSR